MLHSTSDEVAATLEHPAKLTDVKNLRLSKHQILHITRTAHDDVEFMKSMQSSDYNLYFVAELKKSSIVLDSDIKDALLFDHSIGDKLFVYQKEDLLIMQELTSTYAVEYHVGCSADLKEIRKRHILESRPRQSSREMRRITQESEDPYGKAGEERQNVVISFNEVKEVQWRPQDSFVAREGEMPNPEELLIPESCEDCRAGCNHIKLCRFSRSAGLEVFPRMRNRG